MEMVRCYWKVEFHPRGHQGGEWTKEKSFGSLGAQVGLGCLEYSREEGWIERRCAGR